jgi:hypothetical protein
MITKWLRKTRLRLFSQKPRKNSIMRWMMLRL